MGGDRNIGAIVRTHEESSMQKRVFWLIHFAIILFCCWLTYFNGVQIIGKIFGFQWTLSDLPRARILLLFAILYWLRFAITTFYLLERKIGWDEVLTLLPFFAIFEIGLLVVGGGAFRDYTIAFNWLDLLALALLLVGSFLNSFSELQRKWWKRNPSNKGKCYTKGLFKYSMHINYFGDLVLFSGWCLFTHNIWTFALPIMMAAMFIFMHIPGLDSYLAKRYGAQFEAYAARTKKLVPFVY